MVFFLSLVNDGENTNGFVDNSDLRELGHRDACKLQYLRQLHLQIIELLQQLLHTTMIPSQSSHGS